MATTDAHLQQSRERELAQIRLGRLHQVPARWLTLQVDVAELGGKGHGVAVHLLQQPAAHAKGHALRAELLLQTRLHDLLQHLSQRKYASSVTSGGPAADCDKQSSRVELHEDRLSIIP